MSEVLNIEEEVVSATRRIIRAVGLHSQRLVEKHGITGPQLAVLRETDRLNEASVGAIARSAHLSLPTVTGILRRLETLGLVSRARGELDRRRVMVRLTPAGREKLNIAPSQLQDRFRQELSALDEHERTMILAVLQRVASMMDADTLDAAPHLVIDQSFLDKDDVSKIFFSARPP